jgi:peptidyl-prolyl cis-trans isomerase C
LLVATRDREAEEAREMAAALLQKAIENPESFDDLVLEFSEDPSLERNNGKFRNVPPGQMVRPFEEAVEQLGQPGEFSDLVQTRYGFHIIRLDEKREASSLTFDQVKSQLISRQASAHRARLRNDLISSSLDVPFEIVEGAKVRMLKRYYGENLEKAPDYQR